MPASSAPPPHIRPSHKKGRPKKKLKKLKRYTLTTEITVTSAGGSLTITRKTKVKRK